MTVSSTSNRRDFNGNGSSKIFPCLGLAAYDVAHVVVVRVAADGTITQLSRPADFSVTGVNTQAGITVTTVAAPAAGESLIVRVIQPLTQPTDIKNQGQFYPEVHERVFDRLTKNDQQQQADIDRAVKVPFNDPRTPEQLYQDLIDVEENAAGSAASAAQSADAAEESASRVDLGALDQAVEDSQQAQAVAEGARDVATAGAGTATSQAGIATAQANRSESEADRASAAAGAADVSAAAALAAQNTYASTSAGLAGTTSGQVFLVATADPQVFDVYRNDGGSAVLIGALDIAGGPATHKSISITEAAYSDASDMGFYKSLDSRVEIVMDETGEARVFSHVDSERDATIFAEVPRAAEAALPVIGIAESGEGVFELPYYPSLVRGALDADGAFRVMEAHGPYHSGQTFFGVSAGGDTPPITPPITPISPIVVPPIDRAPRTMSGTYTGTGASQFITLGFKPTWGFLKAADSRVALMFGEATYLARAPKWTGGASQTGSVVASEDGFTVGTNSLSNANGMTYYYFAFGDNGTDSLVEADHAGNQKNGRVIRYFEGRALAGILFKRDAEQEASWLMPGAAHVSILGAAGTNAELHPDGTFTVDSGLDINTWGTASFGTPGRGESCAAFGITRGSSAVHVTRYTGTGAEQDIAFPFPRIEAFFVIPLASSVGADGGLWCASLPATQVLPFGSSTLASTAGTLAEVRGGRVRVGSGLAMNKPGVEYVMVAFRRSRVALVAQSHLDLRRGLRRAGSLQISGAGGVVDCGTDSSLQISGGLTLEWFGQHTANSSSFATLSTPNQDTTLQPLMWRSGGDDGTDTSVSFGLMAGPKTATSATQNQLLVAVCPFYNLPTGTGADLDATQPWQTGVPIVAREDVHILVTHDGHGFWRVYKNGVLVKERDRDMMEATTPRGNIVGGDGHRMLFGGRQLASTQHISGKTAVIRGARVWSRALMPAEATQAYNSWFADNTDVAPVDFVEEWLPSPSGTLVATKSSANNGAAIGGQYFE